MKRLIYLIQISLYLFSAITFSQTLESYLTFGGSYRDIIQNVEKAPNGDFYVVGQATNTTDFNPNGTPLVITVPPAPATNVFIGKYHSDMTLSWMVSFRGFASHLVLDDSLNVYAIGYAVGNVDFNPSSAIDTLAWEVGGRFIVKYGSDGTFKGVNEIEGEGLYNGNNLSGMRIDRLFLDDSGNVYAYLGSTIFKYNSNLDFLWSQEIGNYPQLINNSKITSIEPHVTWAPDPVEVDIVLMKNNSVTGSQLDTVKYGYSNGSLSINYMKKIQNDDLLIYGMYWGHLALYGMNDTIEFENNDYMDNGISMQENTFVCRYDSLDNLLWAKIIEGPSLRPNLLETDQAGNIFAFGQMYDTVNFSSGTPVIHTSFDVANSYIAKYDSEFNYLNMAQVLGDHSYICDFDFYGDTAYLCGAFYPPIDIDLTPSEEILESTGDYDVFLSIYSNFDITENPMSVIEEDVNPDFFKVYTNMSIGKVFLEINKEVTDWSENQVDVYDMNGRLLTTVKSTNKMIDLDISNYPNAVYIIEVNNKNWTASKKIVKNFD